MSHEWLHLRLAAPLVAFGGVAIDQVGPTRAFPSASALTGLLANALGWERHQSVAHQALQDRLIFAGLICREGRVVTDNQNARVYENEPGWTTRGTPEARNGGPSYSNTPLPEQSGNRAGRKWLTHRRSRDYLADPDTRVVLRLASGEGPGLDRLAEALDRPARPLFIGRKPCLPSGPLLLGRIQGATALEALVAIGIAGLAQWPAEPGAAGSEGTRRVILPDLRNWITGLHGGDRTVLEGTLA